MACTKCKKKQEREMVQREVVKMERSIKVIFLIFLGLTLYGVYSLFSLFL